MKKTHAVSALALLMCLCVLVGCGASNPQSAPTAAPTEAPTEAPTAAPTPEPTEAPTPEPVPVEAQSLGLADGEYTAEAYLTGGTGKAKVKSPARIFVENGQFTAEVIWSSSNYDFMVVDGEQILPVTFEGGSTFRLPFAWFDKPLEIQADTIAMGSPHLINYTLRFDSATLQKAG